MAALQKVERVAARKGIREGITDATKEILADARANVPEDTKALKKSLGRRVKAYRNGRGVAGIVGARRDAKSTAPGRTKYRKLRVRKGSKKPAVVNPANYAHLVEFGTRPHAVGAGSKLGAAQAGRGHPGTAAQPFLTPAWVAAKSRVPRLVAARVRDRVRAVRAR